MKLRIILHGCNRAPCCHLLWVTTEPSALQLRNFDDTKTLDALCLSVCLGSGMFEKAQTMRKRSTNHYPLSCSWKAKTSCPCNLSERLRGMCAAIGEFMRGRLWPSFLSPES